MRDPCWSWYNIAVNQSDCLDREVHISKKTFKQVHAKKNHNSKKKESSVLTFFSTIKSQKAEKQLCCQIAADANMDRLHDIINKNTIRRFNPDYI